MSDFEINIMDLKMLSNRTENIEEIKRMYELNNYKYNLEQISFLEKYAYLNIIYFHPIIKCKMAIEINPIEAHRHIMPQIIRRYNDYFQDEFLIIGEIKREESTIYLSKKGIFYSAFDDCVTEWGNDFFEMINAMQEGRKGKLIILP